MIDPPAIPLLMRALQIHLLFASLVALAAWAATSSRGVSATAKYWIWVVTSVNFLLPAGALVDRLRPPNVAWVLPLEDFGNVVARRSGLGLALAVVWAGGAALMAARLVARIRAGSSASAGAAPAVLGVFRPRISLPTGIERVLTAPELEAVLLHERTHARRRDNLIRLLHEIAVCVFWFHPLIWLAGSRISLYRELSCDESVIRGARGRELVSAMVKLASPAETLLLQAGASDYMADRVARLALPPRTSPAASALRAVLFALVLLACVLASAFQSNLMQRAAHGEFCSRGPAELAGRPDAR